MHSATKGLDWELEVRALARRIYSQVAELVDAARRELIGSVRFRRWKWCSTNTGSNPVLTTKKRLKKVCKRLGSYHYIPYLYV